MTSAGGFLCSSGFPARALRLASGASGDCGTVEVALGAVWLTRSREAAKGSAKVSGRWGFFEYEYEYRPPGRTEYEYELRFFGGVAPSPPSPLPRFTGARGGMGGQWTVFGLVSHGREFACGFLRSSGFPARALRLGRLGIAALRRLLWGRFGSREAAKPRREAQRSVGGGVFSSTCTSTVRQGGLSTSTS